MIAVLATIDPTWSGGCVDNRGSGAEGQGAGQGCKIHSQSVELECTGEETQEPITQLAIKYRSVHNTAVPDGPANVDTTPPVTLRILLLP